jgi:hypothetical protein
MPSMSCCVYVSEEMGEGESAGDVGREGRNGEGEEFWKAARVEGEVW